MAFLRPFRALVSGSSIPRAAFVASLALGFVLSALQAGELLASERNEGDASIPKLRLTERHSHLTLSFRGQNKPGDDPKGVIPRVIAGLRKSSVLV